MPLPAIPTAALCKGLDARRHRVDQLVSRGIVTPTHQPGPGGVRMWTFADAMRVAVQLDVADAFGMSVPKDTLKNLYGHSDDIAYLVLARREVRLIPSTPRGQRAKPGIPAGLTARAVPEVVMGKALAEFLAQHSPAIVINLNAIEARLLKFWPSAE